MNDAGWEVREGLDVLGCEASRLYAKLSQSLGQIDVDGADDLPPSIEPVEIPGLLKHCLRRAPQTIIKGSPYRALLRCPRCDSSTK